MSFEKFLIHIPEDSPEEGVIEEIVHREHISPEAAVLSVLRSVAN